MPQYLRIADNIYRRFEAEGKFNSPLQEYLNLIVKQLRKDLRDTNLKVMYHYIDFVDGFQELPTKNHINIDVSLIPSYKNKEEFILWLAGFIEKNTEGGVKKIPPRFADIPPDINFDSDILKALTRSSKAKSLEDITAYFNSQDYKDQYSA